MPNNCCLLHAPKDKEQTAPSIIQAIVTEVAARLRVVLTSSSKKAVLTSCKEIKDVKAAIDRRAENRSEMK